MTTPPKVALLIDAARSYERGMILGISRYSELHGPWQFFRRTPPVSGGKNISISALREWEPDGIIIRQQENIEKVLELGLPTVVSPYKDYFKGYPNVLTDDREIGRICAEHLIQCGLRNFSYCGMDRMFFWSRDRKEGFCNTVSAAGFEAACYAPKLSGTRFTWSREKPHIVKWLSSLETPTGLMVCNDDFCLCVMEACRQLGFKIPDDVAIVSVGNDEMICELAFPPLSSVSFNTTRGGYEMAESLAAQLAGGKGGPDIVIRPDRVVPRQSSDVLAVEDPEVAKAVRFIRQNARRAIQVDDVVEATALSRRALYDSFSRAMGRSIYDYIRTIRTAHAAKMLTETSMTITEVAYACDFPDEKNFARFFRKTMNTSPLQYRKSHGFS